MRKQLGVYVVRPASNEAKAEGKKDFWTQIGTAFPHPSGEGFNILLNAAPLGDKLVLLPVKKTDAPQPAEPSPELQALRDTLERHMG